MKSKDENVSMSNGLNKPSIDVLERMDLIKSFNKTE